MFSDFRQALRALRRSPGFTLTVALTLALGIGAVTTLTSVLDMLLFRPPVGVEAPDRVVRLYFHHRNPQFGDWRNSSVSYPDYTDLTRAKGFAAIAASYASSASLGRGAEAASVSLAGVTGGYFPMLGTRPLLGRLLTPADDSPASGPPVAVLSERLWRSRFGSAPDIVGRTVALDDKVLTVVGVAPKHFDGGDYDAADLWAPLDAIGGGIDGQNYRTDRGWYWIGLTARLAPGVTLTQAADEATALIRAGRSDSTVSNGFQNVEFGPVLSAAGPDYRSTADLARWLAAMSVLVLLIASANVANLMLARGLSRARELAVRKALGAGQGRLVRQLFLEGLLTAVIGGGVGVLATVWGVSLLRGYVLPPTMAERFTIDGRVFAIALTATGIAALISSLVPAIQVTRGDLTPVLKEGGRGSGFRRSRLRSGLVVGQVALSVLLVIGAGLFLRSLRNVLAIDIGYDRAQVLMVNVDPASAGFTGQATGQAFETMAAAARAHPGVEAVALNDGEPFGWSMVERLRIAGRDSLPRFPSGGPYIQKTTADYFRTMGLGFTRGRGFTDADRREHPSVAVIGATMAARYFPGQDPIGQCLMLGADKPTCAEIVGVVRDGVRYGPREEPQLIYYVPLPPADARTHHRTMFIRTRRPAAEVQADLRQLMQTAVPELPYVQLHSLDELLEPGYRDFRLGASLFGLYALTALVLAGVGLYSVLAYAVRGRTQELGIRLALGAAPRSLVRLIVRDGVRLVGIGLVLGLLAALATGGALRALLYGVAPTDPVTIGVSAVVMLGTAVFASLLPARRAARVDPIKALRAE
jgi:predicted permease